MREFFIKYDFGVKVVLVLAALFLFANLLVLNRVIFFGQKTEEPVRIFDLQPTTQTPTATPTIDTCGKECQKIIEERVAQAIATLSAQKTTTIVQQTSGPKTSFIPLGGTSTTTNTDWTDVKTGEVWIDIADYGEEPSVTWETFLKVAHGNGKAFARLFDVTNGIAVVGSEVSATSADFTQVSSGNLAFWRGRNLYRVQIKSLNSFVVSFDSGRLKIVSK